MGGSDGMHIAIFTVHADTPTVLSDRHMPCAVLQYNQNASVIRNIFSRPQLLLGCGHVRDIVHYPFVRLVLEL